MYSTLAAAAVSHLFEQLLSLHFISLGAAPLSAVCLPHCMSGLSSYSLSVHLEQLLYKYSIGALFQLL